MRGRIAVFAVIAVAAIAALAGLGFAAPNNPQTLAQRGAPAATPVDAEVVPRSAWDTIELAEGQRIEVVGAIQGG